MIHELFLAVVSTFCEMMFFNFLITWFLWGGVYLALVRKGSANSSDCSQKANSILMTRELSLRKTIRYVEFFYHQAQVRAAYKAAIIS
jgi:hypothetical protein